MLREVVSKYPESDAVIDKGDRVGIWSTINVEWVLLQMATARIGAIRVNINPAYRVEELEYGLRLGQSFDLA